MRLTRNTARRVPAALGLLAVLFQAMLFGWHHHALRVNGHLPEPVAENPAAAAPLDCDEDGCEICQVLHHLTATPADVGATLLRFAVEIPAAETDSGAVTRGPLLGFHARAPPSSDAAIG